MTTCAADSLTLSMPREFASRRAGMLHAMEGGLWLHRHAWQGRRMVHVLSVDRGLLLQFGRALGVAEERLQYKPLKDPRTGVRRDAWHWDLPEELLRSAPSRVR